MTTHEGGCHCGRVRFEVDAPAAIEGTRCNCSICRMTGYLHLLVPKNAFRLLSGQDDIETYTFNTGIAKHYFCRHCGVKSFYVPRSHPSGFSVNIHCLNPESIGSIEVSLFDGANWEQNIGKLSPLND
ncbi:MAG: GFA family protein [Gammaproteobacteria bacterium]|nr:GFA family protein [Gammaproteobacteria bacterium]MDH3410124.1 GFA family protein [Gammaproteobacteria bacterium]MDH3554149.1 GFA family protein [Gammaproteobacteria bacterium]